MGSRDVIFGTILFVVTCVPVLAVAARFTLKPIVDSIIRLREAVPQGAANAAMEARVRMLEDELRQLRGSVGDLEATVDFQQKLLAAAPSQAPVLELVPAAAQA